MAYQVIDAYGSVITIDSSVFGSTHRQIIGASIIGTVTVSPSGNQSVSGTVGASQSGAWSVSIFSAIPSSVIVGASIFGLAPVEVKNTNLNVSGSVVGFQGGTWVPSVINYLKRNDTLASTLGADGTYGEASRDSAGRTLVRPFAAEEARVEGYASLVSTSVTTLVAAAGAGLRNYITDFWVANSGATTTVITFKDGTGSVLGYTIAPATGGSNSPGITTPIRTGANASFDVQPVAASSILYFTVKGFKGP